MEELEEEARKLAAGGVKELIVIAQDTTYYGLDLYGKRRLAELLRRLCRIDGIGWIRLHYAYPTAFPDEVIEAMTSEPKICKYLDIPFQHISDAQISAMHRHHTKAEAYALVEKLRGAIPDLALRTTLLVGYPGETEADRFAAGRLLCRTDAIRLARGRPGDTDPGCGTASSAGAFLRNTDRRRRRLRPLRKGRQEIKFVF